MNGPTRACVVAVTLSIAASSALAAPEVLGEPAEVLGAAAEVRGAAAEVRGEAAEVRGAAAEVRGVPAEVRDARRAFDALEYDRAAGLARAAVERADLPVAQRVEAYVILASSLAVIADSTDAEAAFRAVLRLAPALDLPASTPPKILNVFRKVQFEEARLVEQTRALVRARTIESLRLIGELPETARGGDPIAFGLRLRDPTGAVESVRVPFRRSGERAFSALALAPDESGTYRGAIPGEATENEGGFTLEYFVETLDREGPLVRLGSGDQPLSIPVAPGRVSRVELAPWVFWSSAALASAALLSAGAFAVLAGSTQGDFDDYQLQGRTAPIDGEVLGDLRDTGERHALAARVSLGAALVAGAGAAIAALLTDWD